MTKSHRAPAGSRAMAAQVAKFAGEVSPKALANQLGYSVGHVNRLLKATAEGNIGKVFHTKEGLANWQGRLDAALKRANPEVKQIVTGERRASPQAPAPTKAGQKAQSLVGDLHAQYKDKDIAKHMGVSRQQATAWRLKAEKGEPLPPAAADKFREAKTELNKIAYKEQGVNVISRGQAARMMLEGAQPRGKHFPSLQDAVNWANKIIGAGKDYFYIVDMSNENEERYDVLFYDEDPGFNFDQEDQDEGPNEDQEELEI